MLRPHITPLETTKPMNFFSYEKPGRQLFCDPLQ